MTEPIRMKQDLAERKAPVRNSKQYNESILSDNNEIFDDKNVYKLPVIKHSDITHCNDSAMNKDIKEIFSGGI